MSDDGIRSTDQATATTLDEVLGNVNGTTVRVPTSHLAVALRAHLGPTCATRAELQADLNWPDQAIGTVWDDPLSVNNGDYVKAGAHGTGSWTKTGEGAIASAVQKARAWAEETEDTQVAAGRFSAMHHSAKAAHAMQQAQLFSAAAAGDAGNAATASTQAQLAAVSAGAPIFTTIVQGEAASAEGDVFLVAMSPGMAVFQMTGGVAVQAGWLGELLYNTIDEVKSSTEAGFLEGQIIRSRDAQATYKCAAQEATDYDLVTAGGQKLYVQPDTAGRYLLDAFDLTNTGEALERALTRGPVVLTALKEYVLSSGASVTDTDVVIEGNGATLRRAPNAEDASIISAEFSFSDPVDVVSVVSTDVWCGYPTAKLTSAANFVAGDTVSIKGRVYTFVAAVSAPDEVRVGSDLDESLSSLSAAINAGAGEGTSYGNGTDANQDVTARLDDGLRVVSRVQVQPDFYWVFGTTASGATWEREFASTVGSLIQVSAADFANLNAAPGDVFKIVSDDLIPWSRWEDQERVGEHFVAVATGSGVNIYTSQPLSLIELLVAGTNVQLAKMTKKTVQIRDLHFCDSEGFDPTINDDLIRIRGAVEPKIENLRTTFSAAGFIRFDSCWRPTTRDVFGANLRSSFAYYAYGYVVVEYGCTAGLHFNLVGTKCRHVYTTGGQTVDPTETDPEGLAFPHIWRYGGVVGTYVQGVAFDCEHYAFDTHPDAFQCCFDVVVRQGYRGIRASLHGVQLRGEQHRLRANIEGQAFFTAIAFGEGTLGHDIDIQVNRPNRAQGETSELIRFVNDGTGAAEARLAVHGTVEDWGGPIIDSSGVDLVCREVDVQYAPTTDYTGSIFYVEDCEITCHQLAWDMAGSVALTPRLVRQKGANGAVTINHAHVRRAPQFWVGDLGSQSSAQITVHDLRTSSEVRIGPAPDFDLFANRVSGAIGAACVRVMTDAYDQPNVIRYVNNAAGAKAITWTDRLNPELVLAPVNNSGVDVEISQLTGPMFDGQRLTINNRSENNHYTLTPGTAGTQVPADIALAPGETVPLIGVDGVWVSAAAPIQGPFIASYSNASAGAKDISFVAPSDRDVMLLATNNSGVDVDVSSLTSPSFDGQSLTFVNRSTTNSYVLKTTSVNVDIPIDVTVGAGSAALLFGYGGDWIAA